MMTMLNDQVIQDNNALIERNRDLECELAALKAKLGRVSRVAFALHHRAVCIMEEWGDEPMGGTDLGRCHAFEQAAGEIREAIG